MNEELVKDGIDNWKSNKDDEVLCDCKALFIWVIFAAIFSFRIM